MLVLSNHTYYILTSTCNGSKGLIKRNFRVSSGSMDLAYWMHFFSVNLNFAFSLLYYNIKMRENSRKHNMSPLTPIGCFWSVWINQEASNNLHFTSQTGGEPLASTVWVWRSFLLFKKASVWPSETSLYRHFGKHNRRIPPLLWSLLLYCAVLVKTLVKKTAFVISMELHCHVLCMYTWWGRFTECDEMYWKISN